MADRFKYSEVRQKIIDDIRLDLIGPKEEEEVLEESPRFAYLVGMLDIQKDENSDEDEQEVDTDIAYDEGEDYTAGEEDDNEPIMTTHFQIPSSMGISFYIRTQPSLCAWMCPGETMSSLQKSMRMKMGKNTARRYILVFL